MPESAALIVAAYAAHTLMGKRSAGWANRALGAALLVFGLAALVLLYGFVSHTFFASPAPDPAREGANPTGLVGEIIQVSVLNGCGVANVAAQTTRYLRDHGFDVVENGNYSSFGEAHSFVIDRVGNIANAEKVAAALGIPTERVRQDIRPEYFLDATVVIGNDYRRLEPFSEGEP